MKKWSEEGAEKELMRYVVYKWLSLKSLAALPALGNGRSPIFELRARALGFHLLAWHHMSHMKRLTCSALL